MGDGTEQDGAPAGVEDVRAFGALFQQFLDRVVHAVPARRSRLAEELSEHLGVDVGELPVTGVVLSTLDHADLQLALDTYLAAADRSHRWIGLGANAQHADSFTDVLAHGGSGPSAVGRRQVPTGLDEVGSVVTSGAALVAAPDEPPHAVVVRVSGHGPQPQLSVEVVSAREEHADEVLDELRRRMAEHSVYRGRVISLAASEDPFGRMVSGVTFLPRPGVERRDIVLPAGVLERIERRTTRFSTVGSVLREQGHDARRGLLLHGPPGTGKTLTVRYLTGQQPERTVVVLAGVALMGGMAAAMALARRLQPATVVLEDVDLVAQQRQHGPMGNPLLFTLLNELDGLGSDADVLVLLTTNRADLLEPALAARPGRVDLAVELPLPALAERERLLRTVARGVPVADDVDWATVAERIEGTPASFAKELLRTAAVHAALLGVVRDDERHGMDRPHQDGAS